VQTKEKRSLTLGFLYGEMGWEGSTEFGVMPCIKVLNNLLKGEIERLNNAGVIS